MGHRRCSNTSVIFFFLVLVIFLLRSLLVVSMVRPRELRTEVRMFDMSGKKAACKRLARVRKKNQTNGLSPCMGTSKNMYNQNPDDLLNCIRISQESHLWAGIRHLDRS